MTRLRVNWLQHLNRVKNRIGDVCETGNIKVSSVALDHQRKLLASMLVQTERLERDVEEINGPIEQRPATRTELIARLSTIPGHRPHRGVDDSRRDRF